MAASHPVPPRLIAILQDMPLEELAFTPPRKVTVKIFRRIPQLCDLSAVESGVPREGDFFLPGKS